MFLRRGRQIHGEDARADPSETVLGVDLDPPEPVGLDQHGALEGADRVGAMTRALRDHAEPGGARVVDHRGSVCRCLDERDRFRLWVRAQVPGLPDLVPVGVLGAADMAVDRELARGDRVRLLSAGGGARRSNLRARARDVALSRSSRTIARRFARARRRRRARARIEPPAQRGVELRLRGGAAARVVDDPLDHPAQRLGQPVEVAIERPQTGQRGRRDPSGESRRPACRCRSPTRGRTARR